PSRPIREQGYFSKGDVIIGDGAWIGIGACILSGVQIGKGSVIGANSVVTHNIPSYSVAAGSPARVIKRYDFSSKRWLRV
ncbi:MAG: DapH/DapD/GlmU-related protein, partial [Candidatus Freyarchaeota archaeon]